MILLERKVKSTDSIELETIITQHNEWYDGTILAIPAVTSCAKRSYYIFKDLITPENNLRLVTFSYRGHAESTGKFSPASAIDDIKSVSNYFKNSEKSLIMLTSCSSANSCLMALKEEDYTAMHIINGVFNFSRVFSPLRLIYYGFIKSLGLMSDSKKKELTKEFFQGLPSKAYDHRYGFLYYDRIDNSGFTKGFKRRQLYPRKLTQGDNIFLYINENDKFLGTSHPKTREEYLAKCRKLFPKATFIYLEGDHQWEADFRGDELEKENKKILRRTIEKSIRQFS